MDIEGLDFNAIERSRRELVRGTAHMFEFMNPHQFTETAVSVAHDILSEAPRDNVEEFDTAYHGLVHRMEVTRSSWDRGLARDRESHERLLSIMKDRFTLGELRKAPGPDTDGSDQ